LVSDPNLISEFVTESLEHLETAEPLLLEMEKRGSGESDALNEIFRATGVERFGLVTPYRDDVQEKIAANYARSGFECVAERHLGLQDNFSFSEVSADRLRALTREVARAKPQAITIFCTNLRGAPLVEELERELGIPIYDTIATVVWKSLRLAGVDTRRVQGWGRLFREV